MGKAFIAVNISDIDFGALLERKIVKLLLKENWCT